MMMIIMFIISIMVDPGILDFGGGTKTVFFVDFRGGPENRVFRCFRDVRKCAKLHEIARGA